MPAPVRGAVLVKDKRLLATGYNGLPAISPLCGRAAGGRRTKCLPARAEICRGCTPSRMLSCKRPGTDLRAGRDPLLHDGTVRSVQQDVDQRRDCADRVPGTICRSAGPGNAPGGGISGPLGLLGGGSFVRGYETIALLRLNNLKPSLESTALKLLEEAGEMAALIGKFRGMSGERVTMDRQQVVNEISAELLDVAQTAVTMMFVLEAQYQVDLHALIDEHIRKLLRKGYLRLRPEQYGKIHPGVPALLAISYLVTPLVRWVALRCGVVDKPGERSAHTEPNLIWAESPFSWPLRPLCCGQWGRVPRPCRASCWAAH